ncbi:hypothetical protein [Pseudoxanthomonas kaohsiungensis]|uniref:Uncharacterized protein n=1 Tax=Pseudoxanthomonas kaohsiungensis TaxID=283923 RepID=A0ABW3LSP5_9GAMM|nr:hypothetical protein [Pseudoxanthomonas kaohsiungensis]KAF1704228.1 hypothetical protein CSC66_05100 [Pseudoxanthomonas kaohsiungensis]
MQTVIERVIQKVASFQSLDEGEEVMWHAAQAAYRRTRIKKRALQALSSGNDGGWSNSWGVGDVLAVALILNRQDVLSRHGYTILQAMERINPFWIESLARIEAELKAEGHLPGRLP